MWRAGTSGPWSRFRFAEPGERGEYNNRVSGMFAELPRGHRGSSGPVAGGARRRWTSLKDSGQAVAGEVLTSLSGFAPPLLLALGGRLAARSPNRSAFRQV